VILLIYHDAQAISEKHGRATAHRVLRIEPRQLAQDLHGTGSGDARHGGQPIEQQISSIGPGETQTVKIPLTPAPKGQATLDVEVRPVPGEQVSSNNKASYTVTFQ